MKLKQREKILAGISLGLVVLIGLWFLLFAGDPRSVDQLLLDKTKLTSEVAEKKKMLEQASREAKRLADWQRRALPPESSLAASLYQNWLSSLTDRSSFRSTKLTSSEGALRRDQFTRISFTLNARAKLEDLVRFLYEFYSAGYLHQIRKIDAKPVQNSRDLDVVLSIEALSLPTAVFKDRLSTEAGHELKLAKLSAYRDPIVARNLFTPYVRPETRVTRIIERPKPPAIDPAKFAYVNAVIEIDGTPQVWIEDRMARPQGKLWQLGSGESFTVGEMKGTVQSILPGGEVIVDFDKQQRRLKMGDNLRGGEEIPVKRPKAPDPQANSTRSTAKRDN